MRYNISPAWDAGYAIPDDVRDEPLRRSHLREGYSLPRGFYDATASVPHAWNPGYALPANVDAEPIGTNPITTRWLARGTVGALIPPLVPGAVADVIDAGGAGTPEMNALSGSEWMDAQSWRYGFGDDGADAAPLAVWAGEVANGVISAVRGVAPRDRTAALRLSLDEMEPGLAGRVESSARRLAAAGVPRSQALRVAIQDNVKSGLIQEALDLASGGAPRGDSLMGLGIESAYDGYMEMGGPLDWTKRQAKKIGKGIKKGAKGIGKAAKEAGKFAGKATCKLLSSEKGQLAIGAAAGLYGAPPDKAMVGAQVGAGMCQKAGGGEPPPTVAPQGLPMGLILGGAAILGVAILVSQRKT